MSLPVSKENLKIASDKVELTKRQIALGQFDYATAFPSSKGARTLSDNSTSKNTVEAWCKVWLKRVADGLKPSTHTGYAWKLKKYWYPAVGSTRLHDLTGLRLLEVLDGLKLSRNTVREIVVPLRLALADATERGQIKHNPFGDFNLRKLLKTKRKSKYKIEPFSAEEKVALYDAAVKLWPSAAEMPVFMWWTGLRSQEITALTWNDVDLAAGTVSITHTLSKKADVAGGKTVGSVRTLKLWPPAREALQRQRAFTQLAGGPVFPNPVDGSRWTDSSQPSSHFWPTICKAAKVRYRNMYQCRHTFATTMLDRGEDARWLAPYLGHKDVTMLFTIYGKERVLNAADKAAGGYQLKNLSAWE